MSEQQPVTDEVELFKSLFESSQSVQLATQGQAGPEASYAPFIYAEEALYIFISQLASHTDNLMRSSTVGVMLIEDEVNSRNPFARNRIMLQCVAKEIQADASGYKSLLLRYREKHGPTVDLLCSLSDFKLFRLTPQQGRLVIGFGRAFTIQMPGFRLEPIRALEVK